MTEHTNSPRPWAFLLALSVAAMGAALGGCARDNYYCDNTGCYFCDGVGCREVTPPPRPTCRGDYECASGQVCTNLGCASSCDATRPCPQGWVCNGGDGGAGLCVAPREMPPTRTPGACQTNAECGNGTVCLDGVCTRTSTPACMTDAHCASGQVCVAGRCTASSETCQFNNQCGPGRVCVNSACRPACDGSAGSCPTGQECVSGICRDRVDGCTNDESCAANQRCVNGTCYQGCTPPSGSCGSSELYCTDEGVCLPDTRPRPFCDAQNPCQAGSECVAGVCRVPCMSSDQCARFDVSYRNCGRISYLDSPQTYCLTDREYRPTCTRQSDCGAGQSCIDGACQ